MWPFRKKKKAGLGRSAESDIKIIGNCISIRSIDFFGPFSTSPNGIYILAWSDADKASGRVGARDKGEGHYVLFDKDKLLLHGTIQRPNDGHIANNGTFVLNDWMFGDRLRGTFYAIDCRGNVLVGKLFEANLLNNGISHDGGYAVCQNANSDTDDGGKLNFFNLGNGQLVWSIWPEGGWADRYEFDIDNRLLFLYYESKKHAYTFSGEFIG